MQSIQSKQNILSFYDTLNKNDKWNDKPHHHFSIEELDIYVNANLFSQLTIGAKNTLSCCKIENSQYRSGVLEAPGSTKNMTFQDHTRRKG